MKTLVAVLLAALLTAITVPVASAAPAPGLCPTETLVTAFPWGVGTWGVWVGHEVDVYDESNHVVGLQLTPCTTLDGSVAPADEFYTTVPLPVCWKVPVLDFNVCVI